MERIAGLAVGIEHLEVAGVQALSIDLLVFRIVFLWGTPV